LAGFFAAFFDGDFFAAFLAGFFAAFFDGDFFAALVAGVFAAFLAGFFAAVWVFLLAMACSSGDGGGCRVVTSGVKPGVVLADA
jgi:hypothetical protein